MAHIHTSNRYYRLLVFWVGIVATIAYRIIVVLNFYSPRLVEIAWYIGTIGFIWYFAHRYRVEHQREQLIEDQRLVAKIKSGQRLSAADKEDLIYVLHSLKSSKAKWNYIAIFFFSLAALVYAIGVNLAAWL